LKEEEKKGRLKGVWWKMKGGCEIKNEGGLMAVWSRGHEQCPTQNTKYNTYTKDAQ
jgi:hypothetical protein